MPEGEHYSALKVLLDQNVPRALGVWLRNLRPPWHVAHVSEIGLEGKPDAEIFGWSQENGYLIVTFDEDFADQRSFPIGQHHGVIRLRVWPTTIEETQSALSRLLEQADDSELVGALVIVGQHHIRIRTSNRGDASDSETK